MDASSHGSNGAPAGANGRPKDRRFGAVALRRVEERDMPFLFRLLRDHEGSPLWSRDARDEREFREAWIAWTTAQAGAKLLVEIAGRPVGLVFEYDRCLRDGHAKVTALIEEHAAGRGVGVIATTLLEDRLFRIFPLRKVYHEVHGYDAGVVQLHRRLGFAEEGVLRAHRSSDGAASDLHVFALHREAYPAVRDRILPSRRRVGAPAGARPEAADPPCARTAAATQPAPAMRRQSAHRRSLAFGGDRSLTSGNRT